MALFVGESEVPLQQALHAGIGGGSWFSSFKIVFLTLGSGRRIQKKRGAKDSKKPEDEDQEEDSYSGLSKNVMDRYHDIVCHGAKHPRDTVESASGGQIPVLDISLYDYASTGPNANFPGTFVPVASGLGYLKPVYHLKPKPMFCLPMLRLYKPGFTWGGPLVEGVEGGPADQQVLEFQSFLLEDVCPAFVWADCARAEAKHLSSAKKKKGALSSSRIMVFKLMILTRETTMRKVAQKMMK
jgi:hypothetical protein